jgi:hypothetical protein
LAGTFVEIERPLARLSVTSVYVTHDKVERAWTAQRYDRAARSRRPTARAATTNRVDARQTVRPTCPTTDVAFISAHCGVAIDQGDS